MSAPFVTLSISTPTSIQLMDLRTSSKIYNLPEASNVPNLYLLMKDYYGFSSTNRCVLSTVGADTIDTFLTSYDFNRPYGSIELVNDSVKNWTILSIYDGIDSRRLNG